MHKVEKNAYTLLAINTKRGCLSYILSCNKTHEAVVIDPSEEAGDEYERLILGYNLTLKCVVDTHTHADHVSSHERLTKKYGVPYIMYETAPSKSVGIRVREGTMLNVGELKLLVLHTPGHASDSISLVLPDAVFTGDSLLIGGTGRTDLRADSSSEELYDSIHEKILTRGNDVAIYPGHDYQGRFASTIWAEKESNPRMHMPREEFIKYLSEHHPPLPELLEESLRRNSE